MQIQNNILRSALWLGFFSAIVISWWALWFMATDMGLNWMGLRVGPMNMMGWPPMDSLRLLIPMWAVMMVAMMGPTFVHTLQIYEQLMISANGTRAGWVGLILGYFIVWSAFAVLIAVVQMALMQMGWLDIMGQSVSLIASAILLIVVGVFQFTWVKEVCHGICHSPMTYFLAHWRTGFAGGVRMGLGLGAFCVVCCWGFMALGFVGGTMNLLWMGLATILMTLEKLPQVAHYVLKPIGSCLVIAGVGLLGYALFS